MGDHKFTISSSSVHQKARYAVPSDWARVVGYGPFSLCVIYKEGLRPSSGGINGLVMMKILRIEQINVCSRETRLNVSTVLGDIIATATIPNIKCLKMEDIFITSSTDVGYPYFYAGDKFTKSK
jgi:hypothetical protein